MFNYKINFENVSSSNHTLVVSTILVTSIEACTCTTPEDNEYGEVSEFKRFRAMSVGLILGGVFFIILTLIACCYFCPCSLWILTLWKERKHCRSREEIPAVEHSEDFYSNENPSSVTQFSHSLHGALTVSSIMILYESQNQNSVGCRNINNIHDPPPPYPGKSTNLNTICYTMEEYPPPPYSPSL